MLNEYSDKPWNWYLISCNPSLTVEMIYKYPDKDWNFEEITQNLFEKEYEIELKKVKFNHIEEQLIAEVYHPKRFKEWWLDEE